MQMNEKKKQVERLLKTTGQQKELLTAICNGF